MAGTVLTDGSITGTWRLRKSSRRLTIAVKAFHSLSARVEKALLFEAEQTIAILSDDAAMWQLAASDAELARGEGESERDLANAMRRRGRTA